MKSLSVLKIITVSMAAIVLSGCSSMSEPKHHPDYVSVRPMPLPNTPGGNGAIYQSGYEIVLYEDRKARRIGDIITVQLVENTNASKKSASDISKENATGITAPTVLGGALTLNDNRFNLGTTLASKNEFKGAGNSSQSNKLTGDVTVTVIEVLPNKNLVIRGEKRIGINNGNEYVRISGIVRPDDLTPDNTVLSTKVADATIQYVGDGEMGESSKMGWLAKFFVDSLFPF
ncbi:MAG: flagellar basal body L-ring protein FlgH [Methylococcales bacterium]|jgi:flagellar L-ring protein precursor FlgH|nr:flagellar basal body L-ring protein FlgH [Methylococcales bacterium]MBT7409722.1 flagellar basal body L-ring protein FlgH [Methylococcales bacterium]